MNSEYRVFKALDNNFVIGWVAKTVLTIMVGVPVGFAVAQLLFCTRSVTSELLGSILLGIIVGALVGVAQSSQITKVLHAPKLWIIASIVGWAMSALLFEINWPISRCLTSSNAPSFIPGPWIETVHRPILIFAEQIEKMVKGEIIYGGVYSTVTFLLMGSLMGVMVGVPQGIGQWWVLRKDLHRSSTLIWVNVLIWALTYFFIVLVIDLVNFNQILTLMLIPVVLIVPAAVTALVLVWLQTQKMDTGH
jgi:hypothetical protein